MPVLNWDLLRRSLASSVTVVLPHLCPSRHNHRLHELYSGLSSAPGTSRMSVHPQTLFAKETEEKGVFSLAGQFDARRALFTALILGAVSGVMAWALISRPGYESDFFHYWAGSRTLFGGGDPYRQLPTGPLNPGHLPALYPLPTYLLLIPFGQLPLGIAGGVFMGLSSGLAAWGVARTGAERLPLFLSAPFFLALSLGQWTPLLLAAALIPAMSALVITKPNLGLAVWLARPRLRAAIIGAIVVILSVIVLPSWPREFLANLSGRNEKFVPLFRPAGFLLLLGLAAWRRAEGRLLLAMSAIPQALLFSDQLLLFLIPQTLRQSIVFALCSNALFLAWRLGLKPGDFEVQKAVPYAYGMYLVALAILLWNAYRERQTRRRQADN
jgi:hypothetical protein